MAKLRMKRKSGSRKTSRSVAKKEVHRRTDSEELARLKKLAKKYRPPQEWYDQTDCPFVPTKE